MTFDGFPRAGVRFLQELAENNEREWFNANKARFEQALLQPAVEFVTAVGERLQSLAPNIRYDTRTNGSGSLMRIYRDTRFSKDKTPYKTNIAGMWWEGVNKKTAAPAYGFQLTKEGSMGLMAGMFGFDKVQLQRYREAVADPEQGATLRQAITAVTANDAYELLGEHYKRVPRGYDADDPNADLLRFNGLYTHPHQTIPVEIVTSPDLVDVCMSHFERMAPIQRWLADLFAE